MNPALSEEQITGETFFSLTVGKMLFSAASQDSEGLQVRPRSRQGLPLSGNELQIFQLVDVHLAHRKWKLGNTLAIAKDNWLRTGIAAQSQ